MLSFATGVGLAGAAGLNAYIPLIVMGLLARFTSIVTIPDQWSWLTNEWLLGGLAVLLVVEMIADKIPAVDSVNDIVQTVVRPGSGGIVFGAGSASQTLAVDDPSDVLAVERWVPVLIGVAIALCLHLVKSAARPVINIMTLGTGGIVASTVEDGASLGLVLLALVVPVLAAVLLVVLTVLLVRWVLRRRRRPAPVAQSARLAP
ncbi:DUF4126 domain-containing protein [Sanguibacter sp. 25GB23B1]|uniref:DUF4126 domain-containing protein n=1 Tax=unclassified Sanguibacter TaxID=2645534 RepID=UPI0032AFDFD8